jgi:dTDP-4-amino-4,6-dideoxygalactose transaminase
MYYIRLSSGHDRKEFLDHLNSAGVNAVFHYVPLHSSPAGQRFGRVSGGMSVTNDVAGKIVRLPIWKGISIVDQERVVATIQQFFEG